MNKVTKIGNYYVELAEDQILIKEGPQKNLIRVRDIKNIADAELEYKEFVKRFEASYMNHVGKYNN